MDSTVKTPMNTKQRVAVACLDALLLAELTFCMYWCSHDAVDFSQSFIRLYVPIAVVTLVAGLYLVRKLACPAADLDHASGMVTRQAASATAESPERAS